MRFLSAFVQYAFIGWHYIVFQLSARIELTRYFL